MSEKKSLDIEPETNRDYAAVEIKRWNKLIKKHEKCRIVNKKYKVKKVSDVDKILHRVNVKNSIHYLTVGKNISDTKTYKPLQPLPNPFIVPGIVDKDIDFAGVKNVKESISEDVTYAIDIRDRIFVGKSFEAEPIKGITDVDKNYFSIVQKKQRQLKLETRKYINYLKDSLRLRLQTGYVFDEVLKLNEQLEVENHKISEIRTTLKGYTVSFNEFLDQDHKESMKPLLLYAEEMAETEKIRQLLKTKNTEVVKLRYEIYELEEAWGKSQLCEEFILEFFAILSGNNSSNYVDQNDTADDSRLIEQVTYSESMTSLLQFQTPKVAKKAFEINLNNPSYLLEVFRALEHQCLDYLTFTELLEKPNNLISYHLDAITEVYGYEINSIKQSVSSLNTLISHIEGNNKSLQAHANQLLYGVFKETFSGAEESIIINEYIKQTYSRCISSSDTSITSYNMMFDLGTEYKRILLEMDSVPTGFIKEFVRDVKARTNASLAIARNTRRRLRELETITDQMSRLFKPILIEKTRKLMYRSDPPSKKEPPPPKPKEITEAQKEYLHFFTDFCEFTDDVKDYLSKKNKKYEIAHSDL